MGGKKHKKTASLCYALVTLSWHNIHCNISFCLMGEAGKLMLTTIVRGGGRVTRIRDLDPLCVGILPLNCFVSFSGLTRMPIFSNSRPLPGRLGAHLAERLSCIHKHAHLQKALECRAVMYICEITAGCWLYSLHASVERLWLVASGSIEGAFEGHRCVELDQRDRLKLHRVTQRCHWERKYNHNLIADAKCSPVLC